MRFDAGEFVFREGDEARWFYLLRTGQVVIETYTPTRGPVPFGSVAEGGILGWSWLVPPHRCHFDARATELTRLVAFDGSCLRQKFEADSSLGYEVLKRFVAVITERLEWTRVQLLDLYKNHGQERVGLRKSRIGSGARPAKGPEEKG